MSFHDVPRTSDRDVPGWSNRIFRRYLGDVLRTNICRLGFQLHLIVFLVSFFFSPLVVFNRSRSKLKKQAIRPQTYLNHKLRWWATPQMYRLHLFFFFSEVVVTLVICKSKLISIFTWLQEFIQWETQKTCKQSKNFYSPENAVCSLKNPRRWKFKGSYFHQTSI